MIERPYYLNQLLRAKDTDFIKIITGIRRSGKSTLLEMLKKHLFTQASQKITSSTSAMSRSLVSVGKGRDALCVHQRAYHGACPSLLPSHRRGTGARRMGESHQRAESDVSTRYLHHWLKLASLLRRVSDLHHRTVHRNQSVPVVAFRIHDIPRL